MGFISSLPGPFYTVSYESEIETIVNGQITGVDWTEVGTFFAKFQRGSMASGVVSDQFRTDVAATLFVEPSEVPTGLNEKGYRLKINDEYYSIIYVDNIENVSVEIPLKLWE